MHVLANGTHVLIRQTVALTAKLEALLELDHGVRQAEDIVLIMVEKPEDNPLRPPASNAREFAKAVNELFDKFGVHVDKLLCGHVGKSACVQVNRLHVRTHYMHTCALALLHTFPDYSSLIPVPLVRHFPAEHI
jgi:hypothetical protein